MQTGIPSQAGEEMKSPNPETSQTPPVKSQAQEENQPMISGETPSTTQASHSHLADSTEEDETRRDSAKSKIPGSPPPNLESKEENHLSHHASKKTPFWPKGNDVTWVPKEADIVWTRFDKSRTQALAVIVRCPKSKEGHVYNMDAPSVYCDDDGIDRYLVAFINSDAHVYPPRHYLVKFDFTKAEDLKCMKSKLGSLSLWEKTKRKAVRDALDYYKGKHNFETSHNFRMCSTCCGDGSDTFWKTMRLERGTIHIELRSQIEKKEEKLRKAREKKEQDVLRKAKDREERQQKRLEKEREEQEIDSDEKEGSLSLEDDESDNDSSEFSEEDEIDESVDSDDEVFSINESGSEVEDKRRSRTLGANGTRRFLRGRSRIGKTRNLAQRKRPNSGVEYEDVKEKRGKKRRFISNLTTQGSADMNTAEGEPTKPSPE